ncbi:hypothetical protein BX666DRAFT_985328 [Dichotomocladium elegans]|nr:hypothetical protein BX666DRAFT_985328 [Dichotomocladium elegans]
MRFSLVSVLAVAGYASVAAAQNCNPSYNFSSVSSCISECNKKAGLEQYADYTEDPNSPNFIKSLSYRCAKGTPAYTQFMTTSGICMMSCPKADQDAFTQTEFGQVCTWYSQHMNDACADPNGSPSSSRSLVSAAATPTGVVSQSVSAAGSPAITSAPVASHPTDSAGSQLKLGSFIASVAVAGSAALLL